MIRENKTVNAMIEIYCGNLHDTGDSLCIDCTHLSEYAEQRLIHCPFGENKPTCAQCEVHCYSKDMRAQIRTVMKYAGPRMLLRHPIMTVRHYINEAMPREK
ncbi:MAG: nitrous oxide-stimulated promoter family protein [Candidatus Marinimicrobia bacterium]|nr:nitrous oxide-stimulated promoter family protein [Candidatus Neomarinimicrobiota bacterium]MBT3946606.1 nitrous oxide-stimulated promoter family protein [Candidatus Neomarinimicrobiota bacterium]MBT4064877.1 nitrous oxide-stimulated promoter family protein [Candidatus Neomarinimicrobiota bacterium]MBT4453289.1 nitrous oxide-stimulated promoter family protein [Candidatus Neomarinimicrobiota bacterium]MBT4735576.1 nitrous oxide-stimulated promoter family protein [Candidatus Neomarinimicrobiota